jgi:hypothetical protein
VQQVLGLAQGNVQVSAAVAGQQTGSPADMRAGQFQVSSALAGMLTATTAVDMTVIAMPLDLGFGDIGHKVILEFASRIKVFAPQWEHY